jgi:hypothetical protein
MAPPAVVDAKVDAIAAALAGLSNVELRRASSSEALWEAVLARADRRVAGLLEAAAAKGWRRALGAAGGEVDHASYALRPRGDGEAFPWEVVTHGCARAYLRRELERYEAAATTPPCDVEVCRACGACV